MTPPVDLKARIEALRKHQCSSCDRSDEQWAHIEGWNAALDKVAALVGEEPPADQEDWKLPENVVEALQQEIARWHDQGGSYVKMRFHPQRKWFNGNGEALQWCAKRVLGILALAASPRVGSEPAQEREPMQSSFCLFGEPNIKRHSLCDGWFRHGGKVDRCECHCHAEPSQTKTETTHGD